MTEAQSAAAAFLASPRVILLLFMWCMCTLVAVKTANIGPVRWMFVLTVFMLVVRMLPA